MPSGEYPHYHDFQALPSAVSQVALPGDLSAFLRSTGPFAALYHATDTGTAFIAKLPASEIDQLRGNVLMHLAHQLIQHPQAPVLRSVLTIFDDPTNPLALETFINVVDTEQRETFAALGWQSSLPLYFFDEQIIHRLSKRVLGFPQPGVLDMIDSAIGHLRTLPRGTFDFDRAKQAVLETLPL